MQTLINKLNRYFQFDARQTSLKQESIAGLTTFLTMAYVCLVVPSMLAETGMDKNASFVATCLITAFASMLSGLLSNFPIAIGPSMGLLAYFVYVVVKSMAFSWQQALGAVFISGLLFLLLTLGRIRQWIIQAIPDCLSIGMAAGIGLFIGLIALQESGLIMADPNTLIIIGKVNSWPVILSFVGICLIAALDHNKIKGAIIISILLITFIGMPLGITHYHGLVSLPPTMHANFMQMDIKSILTVHGALVIFTFFLVALFDSTGTLIGVLHHANLSKNPKSNPALSKALIAEGIAATSGALLGVSTTSPYVESAAGIRAGGKTGMTAIVTSLCFIACLFFSPLALTIPAYATAPALLFVACLMLKSAIHIDWNDISEAIPAALTIIMIPFTYSIADGIGFGLISYVLIKLLSGKVKKLNIMLVLLAIIFSIYFVWHSSR